MTEDGRHRARGLRTVQTVPAETPPATTVHPAGRVLWRSAHQVQVEIGARRVVIDGIGPDGVRHLLGRAGPGAAPAPIAGLQRHLVHDGLLWTDENGERLQLRPPHPRLGAELGGLASRVGPRAAELLGARRHRAVAIQGHGRLGPAVGSVLAAAGVGRVYLTETSTVRLHQAAPGGVSTADEGLPLRAAAAAAMRRYAPEVDDIAMPFGEPPDLVVLAVDEPVDPDTRDALHARDCAHLLIAVCADGATIGPLVLPGRTSCLRCNDLHRADRDPAWPALAAQLSLPHRAATANEVALATIAAGTAAMQVLEFLDGADPAVLEGTLELRAPDWRTRRRSWPPHPDCGCLLDGADEFDEHS